MPIIRVYKGDEDTPAAGAFVVFVPPGLTPMDIALITDDSGIIQLPGALGKPVTLRAHGPDGTIGETFVPREGNDEEIVIRLRRGEE